jgi:molybdopterin-containing oxidoreductase family iron-sulfur binding subunit
MNKKMKPEKQDRGIPGDDIEIKGEGLLDILDDGSLNLTSSRRNFLKYLGFSFASAAVLAACKRPVIKAIPYAIQPPELTPRIPLYYASSYFDGHEYCGILVKNFDGRPIKIEGNSKVPFNGEGTTARVQASVLSLYDDARLKFPEINNRKASWDDVDSNILKDLSVINNEGGELVLLTPTIISPSTISLIERFGSQFKNFRWVQYDPISYSAIREANDICFGEPVIPDYHFQNAHLIVSINADFLGTWLAPVHFIPKYVSRRKLNDGRNEMLKHIHIESGLSLTGSNADDRIKIKPSEERMLLSDLFNRIAEKTGNQKLDAVQFRIDLGGLANSLLDSKGQSIIVSGTNDREIQVLVNAINYMLGNYGNCLDFSNVIRLGAGSDTRMEQLVDDMNGGKISGLLMYNVNPLYDYYDSTRFSEGLKKIPFTVNMSVAKNETTGIAKYECPVNHFLESWDDYEIIPGQLTLAQPCINRIFDTRQFQESLLRWLGDKTLWHDYLQQNWEKEYFPSSGATVFQEFWNKSLSDGVLLYKNPPQDRVDFKEDSLGTLTKIQQGDTQKQGFEIILQESVALGTGMHTNNPWLIELPEPVSRQCWENVALVSPADAKNLGITTEDVISFNDDLVLPVIVQPGQAEGTMTITLGYGHSSMGPVADNIGKNMFPYSQVERGNRKYSFISAAPEKTLRRENLALVQLHNSMEGRPIARETVLSKYKENPLSGNEIHEEFESKHKSLYPDWVYDGFHWGMAIDLNACVGCATCVIACQAENNSPTVGKDQVHRNRIMQWIKVHRYYRGEDDNPKVLFQPVFCQHCDNAPCENVCPVSATTHNNEGLNQMTYNRCVGTKYCMNNCPYRVRRFNWYRYTNNKAFDYNTSSELGRMVLNPDVTVRERGVVEKCTFCVQRIQAKKLQAKLENRVLADFEIKPACMQACPAGAIIFGNLNDSNSRVSQLFRQERRYHLLEELHTLPSIGYLTKVWNDDEVV